MALTDTAIRAAKPKERLYKLADSGGLYLAVSPSGARLWRLKYRLNGREKILSIGAYPAISLALAREKREEAKSLLAQGGDRSQEKKDAKREFKETSANAFRAIAEEFLEKLRREERAPATLSKIEWMLGLVYGGIGDKPIREITASQILEALRTIERRGRHETARRTRSTIGAVFRYAVATTRADHHPTFALCGALTAPKVNHRSAIIDPVKFGGLLRAIESCDGQPTTKAALQLMAILFPRPGELRMAEWSEFDLAKAIWTIPAERAKMRRPHRMPHPKPALGVLNELYQLTGKSTLVFPCMRTVMRPISENTLNGALRRLGYSKDEVTAHGFRASAATLLNESGKWNPDAIERQLAHVENNDVRRAYTRGEHWDERVKMMDWWVGYLDTLREGGKVLPLGTGQASA
jgi:integrase